MKLNREYFDDLWLKWNSYHMKLNREYFDDLWLKWNSYFQSKNYIQWPVSLMIIVIKFIQI